MTTSRRRSSAAVLPDTSGPEREGPWWKRRLAALALTLALLGLMMSALMLIIYGGDVARAIAVREDLGGAFPTVWAIVQWPVAMAFVVLAINLLYLFAPNVKHRDWHWLMPGTVVALGLSMSVSLAFKAYVGLFGAYRATYGSMATVVVLLLWFYLTGIALLVGGQVNSEIEKASGKVGGSAPQGVAAVTVVPLRPPAYTERAP